MADREYERLIVRHAKIISAAIRRVCGARFANQVPDIEQELRLAVWKRLKKGGKIEHPVAYLHRASLTTALRAVARHSPVHVSLDSEDELVPETNDARSGELLPAEAGRLIEQLLDELPPEGARALRAYLAGFNHVEIARLYGWSESTARHRVYRSFDRLKRRFGARDEKGS